MREIMVSGVRLVITHSANWVVMKFFNPENLDAEKPDYVFDILKDEDNKKVIESLTIIGDRAFSNPPLDPEPIKDN